MRRTAPGLAGIAALALVLAACGNDSGDSNTDNESGSGSTSIEADLTWWDTSDPDNEAPAYDALIEKFNEEYPDVTIKHETVPFDQTQNKFKTAAESGSGAPDILRAEVAWTPEFASLGYLYALDGTAALDNNFAETPLSSNVFEGSTYGVPQVTDTLGLMYNKALFEKAGVAFPPKTLEEMEAAAKAITNKDEGVFGFCGRGKGAAGTSQFSTVMFSNGSEWSTGGKSNLLDPKWLDTMTWYGNLIKNYGPPGATAMTWNQCQDLVLQGKIGMWLDASVFFANLVDPAQSQIADSAMVAMPPAGAGGSIPYVGGWHLSIYSQSKHKEAAWHFVQWALGKEMVLKAQLANITTGRVSAWESEEYKAANKHPDLQESFLAAMKAGNAQWNPPVLAVSEARDAIGVVLVTAIEGGDIKAAAEAADKTVQGLLDATPKIQ